MSKLTRFTAFLFGQNAGLNQIEEFGSFANGTPVFTTSPSTAQSLSNWLVGWFGGVVGNDNPVMEDMNAVCFVFSYLLCYLLQEGIPEYDSGTTYYTGSMVNSGGYIYVCLQDGTSAIPVTDADFWKGFQGGFTPVTTNTNITTSMEIVLSNSTAGSLTHTLPPISAGPAGKRFIIKDIGTGGNTTTVKGSGSDLIDGNNTYSSTLGRNDSIEVINDGTVWWVL